MGDYEYLNIGYKPKNDVVCLFRVEPAKGMRITTAAKTVALESSTGTWTELGTKKKYMERLAAKVFSIRGNLVKIAYPAELFESGNAPNILSSIAGNIFGMKAVKNLRLEDISFPKSIIRGFKGPVLGMDGIKKLMKIKDRPLLGTIIKPKLGLKTKDHAKNAYESVARTLEKASQAGEETGEKKAYLVNVTAETNEMLRRAQIVKDLGGKFIMVDMMTAGFSALQTLRNANLKLAIHAHRAMHAAMTRNPKHGIRMIVLADFARLIGVDSLHIGTGIGKLEGGISDVYELEEEIESYRVKETQLRLSQNWRRIKPVLGVCSGGLHPRHVPYLIRHLGRNILIQAGGGVHWNPRGSRYGAMGMRQAIDAVMKGISLREYAETHLELREALEKFAER
nr:RuBisCO long chain, Form III-b [uncultured bacterium]